MKLRSRGGVPDGSIEVLETAWRTRQPLGYEIPDMVAAAIAGVELYFQHSEKNIAMYDVVISEFLYHPSDSSQHAMKAAAYNATLSAARMFRTDIRKLEVTK